MGLPAGRCEREIGLEVLSVLLRHNIHGAKIHVWRDAGGYLIDVIPPLEIPLIRQIRLRVR